MSVSLPSVSNFSSIVPSFSSIKDGIRTAGNSMLSLFNKYIATPVEHYFIGDLRAFSRFNEEDRLGSGFHLHSFGLLGSFAQWTPKSKEEMAAALNTLDTQPNGRSNYRVAQLLINSSSPFLLANTSSSAIPHRKEISGFLTPKKYVSLTWDLYKKHLLGNGINSSTRLCTFFGCEFCKTLTCNRLPLPAIGLNRPHSPFRSVFDQLRGVHLSRFSPRK